MENDKEKEDTDKKPEVEKDEADGQQGVKWANERLETLLGYGRFQVFQVWVFLGLVGFIGALNIFHLMFTITKKPHRCALPKPMEER